MQPEDRARAALQVLDITVSALEIKWGVCFGVTAHAPPELVAKFDRQWEKLNAAITDARHEDVVVLAQGTIRGCWALDKAALDAGNVPTLPEVGAGAPAAGSSRVSAGEVSEPLPAGFWKGGGDEIPF